MSFIATISATQNNLGQLEIADTTNYSVEAHSTFEKRELFVYKKDGTVLLILPSFSFAEYPSNSITLALSKDYCLRIVLVLTSLNPVNGSKYKVSLVKDFNFYAKQYVVGLGLSLSRNSALRYDKNFYSLFQQYYVHLNLAKIAAENVEQTASQFWLDKMNGVAKITTADNKSISISASTIDTMIKKIKFEATGDEGTLFTLSQLIGQEVVWFFRDDPRPLREVTWSTIEASYPIAGQFAVNYSTGQVRVGVDLQPQEYIQIQYRPAV